MIENLHRKILFSIFAGTLILAILTIYADLNNLLTALKNFKWIFLVPILLLSLLNYFVRFLRWEFYLRKLNIKIPALKSFLIFISGLTMSITPAKFGEALKSYLLKLTDNIQISRSAPIVVAERLTDFIALVILAIYGSFYFNYGREIVASVGLVLVGSVLLISKREFFYLILNQMRKFAGEKISGKIHIAYDSIVELVNVKILIPSVLISTLSWFFECVGFYLVVNFYSHGFSLDLATFIYSFSTIAGAVSMLPGGLGITEGSMTGLLILNKIQKDNAVAITIIIRFATLWFAVGLGIFALYIFQKMMHKFKNDGQS
jgi:uncharacterized protein (TIRG00374 family)